MTAPKDAETFAVKLNRPFQAADLQAAMCDDHKSRTSSDVAEQATRRGHRALKGTSP